MIKVTFVAQDIQVGMPAIWTVVSGRDVHREDICNALTANRSEIDAAIYEHGGLLIRGFNRLQTAEDFDEAIRQVTPKLRDYVGGTSPRTAVRGKIMTATYVPPSWSIPLHQEMAYTKDPPDRIAFFCEKPAAVGGYTTVGDMRLALDRIAPSIRRSFDHYGLQLRRILPSPQALHLKPGVQKSWMEVFGTDDPTVVEGIVATKGWRAEWRSDHTLQLWQDLLPATKAHPVTGELIWCNQAHFFSPACMMAWAQEDVRIAEHDAIAKARISNPEMLDNIFLGNGEPVRDADALHVYRVLRELEQGLQLRRGDLLILDNVMFAHGRTAFEGDRSILVALADYRPTVGQPVQYPYGANREEKSTTRFPHR